jgi:hypothetical protein
LKQVTQGPSKDERRQRADFNKAVKKAREINSLSVAFLRSASILMVLVDRTKAWKIGGRNFATDFGRALNNIEANQSAQMAALAMFYYASLYVVIEGWGDKKQTRPVLRDDRIDKMLGSPYVSTLADFRNSILHPNSILDKRILAFMAKHPQLLPWAMELSDEFLRYFREWRRSLNPALVDSAL